MDEHENYSGKFRQALDVLNDRFRLRWKGVILPMVKGMRK
jgi:hypothetical protein